MGSSPYWYYVPYEENKNLALLKLREREFTAGRYNPVVDFPEFPITDQTLSPGKQHSTIEDALKDAEEDGTRSILDISSVSTDDDYCVARILTDEQLIDYFGTNMPTKEMVDNNDDFFDDIERGKAFCITIYKSDIPVELYFVGYSFD